MPQYLLAGYLPDDFDPSAQDEATVEEIHALNREMIAAGVRKFACGLGKAMSLPREAIRIRALGVTLVTEQGLGRIRVRLRSFSVLINDPL